jgi:hypothetical protein
MAIGLLRDEQITYAWLLAVPSPCAGCGKPIIGHACIPRRHLTGGDSYTLSVEEVAHLWHQGCAQRAGADLDSLNDAPAD